MKSKGFIREILKVRQYNNYKSKQKEFNNLKKRII